MPMVLPNHLQQLHDLDRTLSQLHEQLSDFFRTNEYRDAVRNLKGEDLAWFIEYLRSALAGISDSASVPLQELEKSCGVEMLPESCRLRVKRFNMCPKGSSGKAVEAAVVWKGFWHPNVVPLLGIVMDPPRLISDWMPGGSLTEYITNHPDTVRRRLLSDVAKGLSYLHSRNVIHGSLKGSNVLVDIMGRARITDFGLAVVAQNLDSMRSAPAEHGHRIPWIAPEILDGRGTYSEEADVFSFSMIVIEAFTGAVPFSCEPAHAVMTAIVGGERPPPPTHPTFTGGLWALTQRCWDQGAHLRPRALEIESNLGTEVWKELIGRPLTADERIAIITATFSDPDETKKVGHIHKGYAQTLVDVIDETSDALAPPLRERALRAMRKICGRRTVVPKSLQIPPCHKSSDTPSHISRYIDVWKGEHQGHHVAAKVVSCSPRGDYSRFLSKKICRGAVRWRALHHQNLVPLLGVVMGEREFVMAWEWMANGCIMEFVKSHEDANRFKLLGDVARGLAYLHDREMLHHDLKGASILIDQHGYARLADFEFGILFWRCPFAVPDEDSLTGLRWKSPGLYGIPGGGDGIATKESDYWSLGMVIFEVLSGQVPFHENKYFDRHLRREIISGKRPGRPQGEKGAWFTDDVWELLELCWSFKPEDRPTPGAVAEHFERISVALEPLRKSGYVETDGLCSAVGDPADV